MGKFGPVPTEVKPIAHLLKIADDHEDKHIVVTYWARMGACHLALELVPNEKSKETSLLIGNILAWLEETKKANSSNEGISNVATAQAIIEEYALKLLNCADNLDRNQVFDKTTVKTFYTAGLVMDVLDQFGPLDEDFKGKRKYAKWKAAYIHNCLKNGETPLPGPAENLEDDGDDGMIHTSQIDKDDLKNYTIFQDTNKPIEPPQIQYPGENSDINTPDTLFPTQPATSPITPVIPTNPTPFNTPVPQVTPTVSPSVTPNVIPVVQPASSSSYVPNPEEVQKAQKYCKYATSALNYDDVKTAVDYLTKALSLLQAGKE